MEDKDFLALNNLDYQRNVNKKQLEEEIKLIKQKYRQYEDKICDNFKEQCGEEYLKNDIEGLISKRKKYFKQSKNCSHEYQNERCSFKNTELQKDNGYNLLIANVGKADCIIMENCGQVAVIDMGNPAKDKSNSDGFESVKKFIAENNNVVDKNFIHTLILSHYDGDHIGGVAQLLKNYTIGNIILTNQTPDHGDNLEFDNIINSLFNLESESSKRFQKITVLNPGDCIINHDHKYMLGNAEINILGPVKVYNETNDNSIVAKVTYKQTTYLFTGDMTTRSEKDLLKFCSERNISLKSDVLKVAHHGANTSSSQQFINAVDPMLSIVTNQPKSLHPAFDVSSRLGTFYTTGHNGDFYIHANIQGSSIETNCTLNVNPIEIKEISRETICLDVARTQTKDLDSSLIS